MGLLHKTTTDERAQRAWDDGSRGFVMRVESLRDQDAMSAALDAALAVGWELRATAAITTSINTQVMFFIFVRP